MEEAFLHFIWKFQYFDKQSLTTSEGGSLNILHPGYYNTDAGPDFRDAKVIIDNLEWHGNVEIHINNNDWFLHHHDRDAAYDSVVLHVCWEGDTVITRKDGTKIPVLHLKERIHNTYFKNYKELIVKEGELSCITFMHRVNSLHVFSMFDKAASARLRRKALVVKEFLLKNQNDWESTTFQMLSMAMGMNKNKEPFMQLSTNLPFKLLRKHADRSLQVEALLFGMAGFLENPPVDEYQKTLSDEFDFLSKKYGLVHKVMNKSTWLNARMRPSSFPTVRIAQLAAIVQKYPHLFDQLLHANHANEIKNMFCQEVSSYWQKHYDFGKALKKGDGKMGQASRNVILINTLAPILAAYSQYCGEIVYMEKAIALLHAISEEKNNIVEKWHDAGIDIHSAFDSQAAIEIYNEYCCKKQCLSCNIGVSLVKIMDE